MTYPIPDAALEHHLAILGKTGSGKTVAAKGMFENVLERAGRACAIDPTGVWHGLRSSASGKGPGYPVVIFGGPHGDVPLPAHQGEAIAEIIGTSSTSAVIDTSQMKVSERTRFFTDFADALVRKNKGPLHLVIDEAHLFMPQGRVSDPMSGQMLHAANNLVSLGRSRGLRITIISQRPAKVHKDSLTQVETLVAMRLIAPQDRNAVEAWIEDNADDEKGAEIIRSLATLKTGEAWLWAPEIGVLERVKFPKNRTFDSSRAPDMTTGAGPVLAPIDLKTVHERLATIEADTKANDPKALRAEIARLKSDIANRRTQDAGKGQHQAEIVEALERGEKQGYERGHTEGFNAGREAMFDATWNTVGAFQDAVHALTDELRHKKIFVPVKAPPKAQAKTQSIRFPKPAPQVTRIPGNSKPIQANGSDSGLTNPQKHLLESFAWWAALGHESPTRAQLAGKAGWKVGGSNLRGRLAELLAAGFIRYPDSKTVALTEEGAAIAPRPDMSETFIDSVRAMLSNPQRQLFDVLHEGGDVMKREEVASALNWEPGGSNLRGRFAELRAFELIEYPSRGEVALQDWVR